MKVELVANQKLALETRRDEACAELRESRDGLYRELLDDQREARTGLRWRQEAGFENAHFLAVIGDRHTDRDMVAEFRDAGHQTTEQALAPRSPVDADEAFIGQGRQDRGGMKSGADIGANVGTGLGMGLLSIFESIADGLIGAKGAPQPQREPEPEALGSSLFAAAMEDARKAEQQQRLQEDSDEWRRRQRSSGE